MLGGTRAVHVLETQVTADGVGKYQAAMSAAQSSVSKFKAAVGLAGAGVAALSGAIAGKAVSAAADFQSAMVEVQKVTSQGFAEEVTDDILRMAEVIPLTQNELADLTSQAARFGIRGKENILAFTETAAKMAFATDVSATEAGEAFARLATLTGMPLDEIEELGSAINTLDNNMATSSQEIIDAALRASGTLTQLGVSKQDVYALSAAMNEASESSERAGTRLRGLAQQMLSPSKAAREHLGPALGVTWEQFVKMRDKNPVGLMKEMARVMNAGGKQADELRLGLSAAAEQGLTALAQNWDGVTKAQKLANEQWKEATSLEKEYQAQTETVHAQLTLLKNTLRGIAITIGTGALPALTNLLKAINGLAKNFAEYNRQTKGVAAQNALLIGTFGGLAVAIGALSAPLGAVVAAVGAFVYAWKNDMWGVRDATSRVLGVVRDEAGKTVALFKETFPGAGGALQRFGEQVDSVMTGVVGVIATKMVGAIRSVGGFVRSLITLAGRVSEARAVFMNEWSSWWGFADEPVSQAKTAVMTVVHNLLGTVGSALRGEMGLAKLQWAAGWWDMENAVGLVAESVGRIIRVMGASVNNTIAEMTDAPANFHYAFMSMYKAVSSAAIGVGKSLQGLETESALHFLVMESHITRFKEVLLDVFLNQFAKLPQPVKEVLAAVLKTIVTFRREWSQNWQYAADDVERAKTSIMTVVHNLLGSVASAVRGEMGLAKLQWTAAWRDMRSAAADSATAIGESIYAIGFSLNNTVAKMTNLPPKVHSVFLSFVGAAGEGALGVGRHLQGMEDASESHFAAMRNHIDRMKKVLTTVLVGAYQKLPEPVRNALSKVKDFVLRHKNQIVGILTLIGGAFVAHYIGHIKLVKNTADRVLSTLSGLWKDHKKTVTGALGTVGSFLSDNKKKIAGLIPTAVLLAGKFGAIKTAAVTLVGKLGILKGVLGKIGFAGVGKAAAFLASGPLGWLTGAVIVLAAAWTTDFANARTVASNQLRRLRKDINASEGEVKTFKQTSVQAWNTIRKRTVSAFKTIRRVVTGVLVFLFENLVFPIVRRAVKVFGNNFGEIVSEVTQSMAVINRKGKKTMNDLERFWRKWGDEITVFFEFLMDGIVGIFEFALDGLITAFLIFNDLFQGDYISAWNRFAGFTERTFNGIVDFVKHWGDRFLKFINKRLVQPVLGALRGWKNDVKRTVNTMFTDLRKSAERWIKNFKRPFENGINTIRKKFNWLKRTVVGNSIVPEMFAGLVKAAQNWKPQFVRRFTTAFNTINNKTENWKQTTENKYQNWKKNTKRTVNSWANENHNKLNRHWTNTSNRLGAWKSATQGKYTNWKSNVSRTMRNAKSDLEGTFSSLKRSLESKNRGMLSNLTSKAWSWVPNFKRPFENAKKDVISDFNKLKREVVGNSIVPAMLDMLIDEADNWMPGFTRPFEDAKRRLLAEFEEMKKGVGKKAKGTVQNAAKIPSSVRKVFENEIWNGAWAFDAPKTGRKHAEALRRGVKGFTGEYRGNGRTNNMAANFAALSRAGLLGRSKENTMSSFYDYWKDRKKHQRMYKRKYGYDMSEMEATLSRFINSWGHSPFEMAKGGIVSGPMNAIVGEAGPEAVIPLDKLPGLIARTATIATSPGPDSTYTVEMNIDTVNARDQGEADEAMDYLLNAARSNFQP